MKPPAPIRKLRAVPLGIALFASRLPASSLPLLATHLQLGELHLVGPPGETSLPDSGSFVRLEETLGPDVAGTVQGTDLSLERAATVMTGQLDLAGAFARVQVDAAPSRDDLRFPQVTFQRRAVWPSPSFEVGAGHDWWGRVRLQARDGRTGWALQAGHRSRAVDLSLLWEDALEQEDWAFSLPSGEALATGWNSHRNRAAAQATFAPRTLACAKASLSRTLFVPASGAPFWNLTDSGSARRWSLAWCPQGEGWQAYLSHRSFASRLTTLGWGQDSGLERRRFHALDWESQGYRQEIGFGAGPFSLEGGRQLARVALTGERFPFLAWNSLDNSEWGSVAGLFETRNDRLSGRAELSSRWLRAQARHAFPWLRAEAGLELTRVELEAQLPWSRRKRSLSMATSLETDTLRIRPVRAVLLWPSLGLSRSWRGWELALSARQAIPLWFRQAGDPGTTAAQASGTGSGRSASGGRTLRAALTRFL